MTKEHDEKFLDILEGSLDAMEAISRIMRLLVDDHDMNPVDAQAEATKIVEVFKILKGEKNEQ